MKLCTKGALRIKARKSKLLAKMLRPEDSAVDAFKFETVS